MTSTLAWAGAVVLFLLFTWLARRLLGVRRLSATRTLVSSIVGLIAGAAVGIYLSQRDLDIDVTTLTSLALALLFTMVTVIIFEAVLGPKRTVTKGRSIKERWSQIRRSAEVTRIFSRHGLGEGLGLVLGRSLEPEAAATLGVNLREAFEEAGGVFVKLGQLLATRPDVVPPETARELGRLHARVTPEPRSMIEPVLHASLGEDVDDVFTVFDWTPLGSASIGQVYRAELRDGREVVVKVRRPGVEERITRDLAVLNDLSEIAEQRGDAARAIGLSNVVREFSQQLNKELDYRIEARNVSDVANVFADRDTIHVPDVFTDLSSETVLVLEFVPGDPLTDLAGPPSDGARLAAELFEAELHAMLSGGAFHADLHPGNILLTAGRTELALVDFGAVGRLDTYERAAVTDILTALEIRDPAMLREAALEVGMRSEGLDETGLERSMARLMTDHLGPDRDPSPEVITEFLRISQRHGLRLPASISEMLRALATLDGSLRLLSPGFSLVASARGYARQELYQRISPETLSEDLKREVVRLAPLLRRAPYQLDRLTGQLTRGEMGVRVSLFSTDADTAWLGAVINRALMAFLGAVLGIVSVLLFQTPGGPSLTDNISLFQLLGYIGLFGGAVLVMRVILEVLRDP